MQKAGQSEHSRRLKAIRPYINFNYDLRSELPASAKRKIKKYYDAIEALKARPNIEYRPRIRARLKEAQQFAQHETHLPGIRVAFIPVGNKATARFKVRKSKKGISFAVRERGIERKSIPFSPRKLIHDPDRHIAEVLAKEPKATHFAIQAGKYEISKALTRGRVAPRVKELMQRYSKGGAKFKVSRRGRALNHWDQWMHGINAYYFPEQASAAEYMQSKIKSGKAHRKIRKRRNKR